jgi:hypothetical protein
MPDAVTGCTPFPDGRLCANPDCPLGGAYSAHWCKDATDVAAPGSCPASPCWAPSTSAGGCHPGGSAGSSRAVSPEGGAGRWT